MVIQVRLEGAARQQFDSFKCLDNKEKYAKRCLELNPSVPCSIACGRAGPTEWLCYPNQKPVWFIFYNEDEFVLTAVQYIVRGASISGDSDMVYVTHSDIFGSIEVAGQQTRDSKIRTFNDTPKSSIQTTFDFMRPSIRNRDPTKIGDITEYAVFILDVMCANTKGIPALPGYEFKHLCESSARATGMMRLMVTETWYRALEFLIRICSSKGKNAVRWMKSSLTALFEVVDEKIPPSKCLTILKKDTIIEVPGITSLKVKPVCEIIDSYHLKWLRHNSSDGESFYFCRFEDVPPEIIAQRQCVLEDGNAIIPVHFANKAFSNLYISLRRKWVLDMFEHYRRTRYKYPIDCDQLQDSWKFIIPDFNRVLKHLSKTESFISLSCSVEKLLQDSFELMPPCIQKMVNQMRGPNRVHLKHRQRLAFVSNLRKIGMTLPDIEDYLQNQFSKCPNASWKNKYRSHFKGSHEGRTTGCITMIADGLCSFTSVNGNTASEQCMNAFTCLHGKAPFEKFFRPASYTFCALSNTRRRAHINLSYE